MAVTLEELTERVERLERKVEAMGGERTTGGSREDRSPVRARILEAAREEKATLRATLARILVELGIEGDPMPPKELRRRMIEGGIRPEECLFSRGIIEMREE